MKEFDPKTVTCGNCAYGGLLGSRFFCAADLPMWVELAKGCDWLIDPATEANDCPCFFPVDAVMDSEDEAQEG